ncbi:MAG: metallophosphoesterase, partial [Bacteroidales bacterium]|nr:metallophosphoesterase [Bacteroidales bacterium]
MVSYRRIIQCFSIAGMIFLGACEHLIEYSPYKAGVKVSDSDLNLKAIDSIQQNGTDHFAPFSLGIFGDTHTYYDDFEKQVRYFNRKDDIDFVVHMGDLTLSGIYREFMWFRDISSRLNHPLLTIIGNHDYLSNGEFLYQEMFGPLNYTMVYN